MNTIFDTDIRIIEEALNSIDEAAFEKLINDSASVIAAGNKLILSGLGKNVPLCEKFVGTMVSLGLPAYFMHTNSALHGDLGLVCNGDLVILLSKSGNTAESIHLYNLLRDRSIILWLLTFDCNSQLGNAIFRRIVVNLEHEGDMWNIVPNHSSIINLFVLQKLCIRLADKLGVGIETFKRNHPGGYIGEILRCRI